MPAGFGCSGGAVLTIVELLEEAGLPQLCIAVAEESDAGRVLGGMFAEAVKVSNFLASMTKSLCSFFLNRCCQHPLS
jgi:hypothetical protein